MVVAIGAFNEAVDHEDAEVSRQLQTLALEQYSRALEQTVSRIEIIAQEHLLIAALMFSFFESIRGHTLAALRQLYSAISALLRHWTDDRAIPVIEDDLRPILAFTHVRASALYPQILQIPAPLNGDLPQRFDSMNEAHLHFFAIAQRISTELDLEYRRGSSADRPALTGAGFLARFNAWRERFVEFINGPEPTCHCEVSQVEIHHRLGILFMQIQYLSAAIRLRAGVIASEMAFDSHVEDIKRILNLHEQIMLLFRRPDYDGPAAARCLGFTPSVLPTLAMLGLRCRDAATRRRITAIIRSAGNGGNQLGNKLAAEILEKVTEVEESLATRQPAQEAADIPIEARLVISAVTMFKYDAGTQQFAIVSDYGDPDLVRVRYLRPHTVTATEAGDEKQLQSIKPQTPFNYNDISSNTSVKISGSSSPQRSSLPSYTQPTTTTPPHKMSTTTMPNPTPRPNPTSTLTTPTEPSENVSDITISLANPTHTDALVTLINEAFYSDTTGEAWLTDVRTPVAHSSFIQPMLSDPDLRFLIATAPTDPSALLACCFVRYNPTSAAPSQDPATAKTTAWLGFLCVRPKVHGTGLGGKMLAYAEEFIRREWPLPNGPTRVEINVVNTRTGLMGYYERKGFRRTGRQTAFPYGPRKGDGVLRDDLAMVDFGKDLGTGE
ncbi:uncharacterized protein AB675_7812 [Cyphellophora attinorum]|uniref:N-acetyltransferase domain-containing protein n=1 Tax=Cyphellophora attinorum TaxID=1664694 RepID=A0A0N0NMM3_9EURO|nr:uncharacterized protein AB675_7812 [Phialophora attinorum]KPI40518.1 hypothetical protein AB675_7812 [Phialophora attinorum]